MKHETSPSNFGMLWMCSDTPITALCNNNNNHVNTGDPVADPSISQGAPTSKEGAPIYYFAKFLPNCMKMKGIGQRGRTASVALP